MSTVDIEMQEERRASERRATERARFYAIKATGAQIWWNIGQRCRRKGDAGEQVAIERQGLAHYQILTRIPQDGTWYGAGSESTLDAARKRAVAMCDELYG